ncbi:hypothetical protein ASPCAL00072 [Aspergillus calidoustus]|uniref:Uncharacterized protein n=1 Tax=Aspergillus calidoustus TaxID=454130 RepID=A0A0U5FRA5_ASPCI|nr:hypothetical protein ASPCAL00072 [Aspergillus calidoustus]
MRADRSPMAPYPRIEDIGSQDPYPPQAYHTQRASRSVHVDFTNWTQGPLNVTDVGSTGAAVYTVTLTSRRQQMKFFPSGSQSYFATVDLRTVGPTVEANIHNHNVTIGVKTRLKKEGVYISPSLQGATLVWKSQTMKVVDLELRDGNGIPLAQFNPHPSWSRLKAGRLDLFGPSVSSGTLMEEVMVTCFALVYTTIIEQEAAAAGARRGSSSPGSLSPV